MHKRATINALQIVKDVRLSFRVHGRKFFLTPPRWPGGPYYIRLEPPSTFGALRSHVHRSLRTNVIGAAKARAKLIIEPILNGRWETAEKLKSRSGYATIGDIIEQYLSQAEDRPACLASSDSSHEECCYGFCNYSHDQFVGESIALGRRAEFTE